MKIISASVIALIASMALGTSASATVSLLRPASGLTNIQYGNDDLRRNEDRNRGELRNDDRGEARFSVGDRLPDRFLDSAVNDWRGEGLSRPSRGQKWVRQGDRFLLVRVRDRMIERVVDADRRGPSYR
jgi:Ni/Co efflux regulator RcnB